MLLSKKSKSEIIQRVVSLFWLIPEINIYYFYKPISLV